MKVSGQLRAQVALLPGKEPPVPIDTYGFSKNIINISLPYTPTYPRWSLPLRFSDQLFHTHFEFVSCAIRPTRPFKLNHCNCIRWRLQITKLLIVMFPSPMRYHVHSLSLHCSQILSFCVVLLQRNKISYPLKQHVKLSLSLHYLIFGIFK
jgi:hypothetical protein